MSPEQNIERGPGTAGQQPGPQPGGEAPVSERVQRQTAEMASEAGRRAQETAAEVREQAAEMAPRAKASAYGAAETGRQTPPARSNAPRAGWSSAARTAMASAPP